MSSTATTLPPYVFEQKGTFPVPYTYTVPGSLEFRGDTASGTFDGTGASGDFLACLTFYSPEGSLLCRMFNPTAVKAGDTAVVTFIPPFGSAASSSGAAAALARAYGTLQWGATAGWYGFPSNDDGVTAFNGVTMGDLGTDNYMELVAVYEAFGTGELHLEVTNQDTQDRNVGMYRGNVVDLASGHREWFANGTFVPVAAGATVTVPWAPAFSDVGGPLINLTNPSAPTWVSSGLYGITLTLDIG